MARIDNSTQDVIVYFGAEPFNPDDLGTAPPIDLCLDCYPMNFIDLEIDHPQYEDSSIVYHCQ